MILTTTLIPHHPACTSFVPAFSFFSTAPSRQYSMPLLLRSTLPGGSPLLPAVAKGNSHYFDTFALQSKTTARQRRTEVRHNPLTIHL
jgi:hypothetical protein